MSDTTALPPANQLADLGERLNKSYAVVMIGSSLRILCEQPDPVTGRTQRIFLSPNDFRTLTRNQHLSDEKGRSVADFFLSHPKRREYRKIDFIPGPTPPGVYNLWTGFPVEPKEGTTTKFWKFVLEVICAGDEKAYSFVRKWLAHLIQKTADLPGTALVLRGKQGTGKNTFVDAIGALLGEHYLSVNSLEQITGRFNSHLGQAVLVHANEATWGGNKQAEGALKAMITDGMLPFEAKGKDITNVSNFKRLIVSSNEQWAVPRGLDDRRFFVLDVAERHKEDQEYFGELRAELDAGGYAALMYDLKNEDLTDFNPRTMPITSAGLDMKLRSATNTVRWLHEFLNASYRAENRHRLSEVLELSTAGGELEKVKVYENYISFCTVTDQSKPEGTSQFWKTLKQGVLGLRDIRPSGAATRLRMAAFPSLADARKSFEVLVKQPGNIDWDS